RSLSMEGGYILYISRSKRVFVQHHLWQSKRYPPDLRHQEVMPHCASCNLAFTPGQIWRRSQANELSIRLGEDGKWRGDIPLSEDQKLPIYLKPPSGPSVTYDPVTKTIRGGR